MFIKMASKVSNHCKCTAFAETQCLQSETSVRFEPQTVQLDHNSPAAFYGDVSSLLHLAVFLLYHARSLLYHARTLLYFGVSLLYLAIFLQEVACSPDPGGAILEHLAACPD